MENWDIMIWVVVSILCVVIEAATLGLATIWFAVGALIAFLCALIGLPLAFQIIIFFVSSVVLLIFTRPIAIKYLKIGKNKTNIDSLIGEEAIVTEDIAQFNTGLAKLHGQVWTAVSENDEIIKKDTIVIVKAIEGVKLIVSVEDAKFTNDE